MSLSQTLNSSLQINPHHAARPELLEVTAYSPTNRPLGCPVGEDNGTFYASFQPDEAGEWKIHVTYDNEDIENSPFRCMVFDPRAVHVRLYGIVECSSIMISKYDPTFGSADTTSQDRLAVIKSPG